jgi:hypothetical protein
MIITKKLLLQNYFNCFPQKKRKILKSLGPHGRRMDANDINREEVTGAVVVEPQHGGLLREVEKGEAASTEKFLENSPTITKVKEEKTSVPAN